jgi:hypothetical protein
VVEVGEVEEVVGRRLELGRRWWRWEKWRRWWGRCRLFSCKAKIKEKIFFLHMLL